MPLLTRSGFERLTTSCNWFTEGSPFGEVRVGGGTSGTGLVAGIQPMHGNTLAVYTSGTEKAVLNSSLNQGHALAIASLLGTNSTQVVVGWREPDKEFKVGVKIYTPTDDTYKEWKEHWIDDNGMACEDLQLADLDGERIRILAYQMFHQDSTARPRQLQPYRHRLCPGLRYTHYRIR